jgi:hypothetical protein
MGEYRERLRVWCERSVREESGEMSERVRESVGERLVMREVLSGGEVKMSDEVRRVMSEVVMREMGDVWSMVEGLRLVLRVREESEMMCEGCGEKYREVGEWCERCGENELMRLESEERELSVRELRSLLVLREESEEMRKGEWVSDVSELVGLVLSGGDEMVVRLGELRGLGDVRIELLRCVEGDRLRMSVREGDNRSWVSMRGVCGIEGVGGDGVCGGSDERCVGYEECENRLRSDMGLMVRVGGGGGGSVVWERWLR